MSVPTVFKFEENNIRIVTDDDDIMFLARDVAKALGYSNPAKALKDHCKSLIKLSYNQALELNFASPNPRGEIFLKESDVYRLTMRSTLPSAERFQDWVVEDVLPSIRKTGSHSTSMANSYQPDLAIQIAESTARMLRMSNPSIVRMMTIVCRENGVSPLMLPNYVDETLTRALGDLLKEHGSTLTAVKVNPMLQSLGILVKEKRRSVKGTTKSFWSITDKGINLGLGKNETSVQCPNETQPRWFVDKFPQLLSLL